RSAPSPSRPPPPRPTLRRASPRASPPPRDTPRPRPPSRSPLPAPPARCARRPPATRLPPAPTQRGSRRFLSLLGLQQSCSLRRTSLRDVSVLRLCVTCVTSFCVTSLCNAFVLRLCLTPLVLPEPNDSLPLGVEELSRHIRDLFFREPRGCPQHLVEALVRLAVDRKGGQTIHPRRRTLQGQHQLTLGLLF